MAFEPNGDLREPRRREEAPLSGTRNPGESIAAAKADAILSLRGMSKAFGGTLAVGDVDLDLYPGEILALLGQNGAGKSTLIKMLAGVYRPDAGEMRLDGLPFDPHAGGRGIAFIHQDLGLFEWMTVAENISLAQGYRRRRGVIDWSAVEATARRSLSLIAHDIDPRLRVGDLNRTEKSLVAIARALGVDARVLVLDEPTASLPQDEVELLFKVLRRLKASGVGMIYVSHRLDEIFAISDCLAVLRDGRLVDARRTVEATPEGLINAIIGRPPESVFVRPPAPGHDPALVCEDLVVGDVGPLSFTVHRGEIVALVGLRGAGQESVGRAMIGAEPLDAGRVLLGGAVLDSTAPPAAIGCGLGFVAADRVAESLAHGMNVRENMFINPRASGRGLLSWRRPAAEGAETAALGRAVGLSPNRPEMPIESLSGGNQQKVVLARWMRVGPDVLILEDPTAGVDVGAKAEIYRLLAAALAKGQALILVSTDFEEVAAICHRALVFRGGRIVSELAAAALSVEALTRATSLDDSGGLAAAAREGPG
jgi:ribose transport system ATP-binding protein